jgi:hypothetical protein
MATTTVALALAPNDDKQGSITVPGMFCIYIFSFFLL